MAPMLPWRLATCLCLSHLLTSLFRLILRLPVFKAFTPVILKIMLTDQSTSCKN